MADILTVTVTLCEEDRKRLDTILEGLAQIARGQYKIEDAVRSAGTPYAEPQEETPPFAVNEPAPAEPAPEPAPAEPVQAYTEADIRRAVVNLSSAGLKAEVKAIVNKYAPRVPAIQPEDYAAVMADLEALGNG